MGIRDIVNPMPETRQELSDYITSHYAHVKDLIEKKPEYKSKLDEAVEGSFAKYSGQLKGFVKRSTGVLSGAGHVAGYAADAWLLGTGDIVGSLGGKFLNLLAQIPEKLIAAPLYGVKTGNYWDAAKCLLEGLVSYVPGLTFADEGLTRIIQKRMVSDAVTKFEKEVGIYKSWTERLADKLSNVYSDVKNRAGNVFTPTYEPA